ncbi:hypothetical protein LXL04_022877 [Taraxacum kok-saghyz]
MQATSQFAYENSELSQDIKEQRDEENSELYLSVFETTQKNVHICKKHFCTYAKFLKKKFIFFGNFFLQPGLFHYESELYRFTCESEICEFHCESEIWEFHCESEICENKCCPPQLVHVINIWVPEQAPEPQQVACSNLLRSGSSVVAGIPQSFRNPCSSAVVLLIQPKTEQRRRFSFFWFSLKKHGSNRSRGISSADVVHTLKGCIWFLERRSNLEFRMKLRTLKAEVMYDGVYNSTKRKMMEFYLKLCFGSVATNVGKSKEVCGVHPVEVCGVYDS